MPPDDPDRLLRSGAERLGLSLDAGTRARLLELQALLERWNRTFNLTAVRGTGDMVVRHLLDSLAVAPGITPGRVTDVGTGPGFPGLPLALVQPDRHFVLLDASGKKTRFVRHAVARLELPNVEVVQARVEDYEPAAGSDTVVCRAFSSLADFVAGAGHLCREGGRMVAMKGRRPADELDRLPAGWQATGVHPLSVPGLAEDRHLVVLEKH